MFLLYTQHPNTRPQSAPVLAETIESATLVRTLYCQSERASELDFEAAQRALSLALAIRFEPLRADKALASRSRWSGPVLVLVLQSGAQ